MSILEEYPFALCLTHDVDRVYKTYQTVYYAVTERDPSHLLDLLPGRNPYWQFEEIMALEAELGVKSAFYVLVEQNLFRDKSPRAWLRPEYWKLYAGRYSIEDPAIVDVLQALDEGGWEIGLHGSYESYRDPLRLRREKRAIEEIVDQPVRGGRQHYLNLDVPRTWEHHAEVGLDYDATLGSTDEYGFQHGYGPRRPFDDEFVVFPLTLMEVTLPDVAANPEAAWCRCLSLLEEAREHGAVMTVLWHPTRFSERDHPNYRSIYRRLIERAQEMGAWIGPPGELYRSLDHPGESATAATDAAATATSTATVTDPAAVTAEREPMAADGVGTVDDTDSSDVATTGPGAADAAGASDAAGAADAATTSEDD